MGRLKKTGKMHSTQRQMPMLIHSTQRQMPVHQAGHPYQQGYQPMFHQVIQDDMPGLCSCCAEGFHGDQPMVHCMRTMVCPCITAVDVAAVANGTNTDATCGDTVRHGWQSVMGAPPLTSSGDASDFKRLVRVA